MSYIEQLIAPTNTSQKNEQPAFSVFLENFKAKMNNVFHVRGDLDQQSMKRGMPPFMLREILSADPMSICIPKEYGGRGESIGENLAMLAAASYESLALSLTLGINSGLFIQPLEKYGYDDVKASVFKRILNDKNMGGLMITEPGHGSDALNMQTSYTLADGEFHIQGKKHWAGLTGWAEFWLLTARKRTSSGQLQRDIDFFLCDVNTEGQEIVVEEFFDNLGLYMIPYGRNRIDVKVPANYQLRPHTTGVKMMLDLLHRSRMQFPGMAMGFIKRMLDEGIAHSKQRLIGVNSLFSYDQVQSRLSKLQASYTVCSAMCANSSEKAGVENDLAPHGLEANAVKSVVTDLMQEAAQSVVQLVGAKAYRLSHIAGRGIADSRPFQIFEGSNDILYAQITEAAVKLMKRAKETNLFQFLKGNNLTNRAADGIKDLVNFNLNLQLPQRKLVEMGKVIGRVISMNQVLVLAENGFREDLIQGGLAMLEEEIAGLIAGFSMSSKTIAIESYEENSSWFNFVKR